MRAQLKCTIHSVHAGWERRGQWYPCIRRYRIAHHRLPSRIVGIRLGQIGNIAKDEECKFDQTECRKRVQMNRRSTRLFCQPTPTLPLLKHLCCLCHCLTKSNSIRGMYKNVCDQFDQQKESCVCLFSPHLAALLLYGRGRKRKLSSYLHHPPWPYPPSHQFLILLFQASTAVHGGQGKCGLTRRN